MPSFVQKIDVNSPLVDYSGSWQLGGADGDSEAVKYDQDTFVFCAETPSSATIHFNGTEVHVVGAYRKNSGPFQVTLDGSTSEPLGTVATVTEQFQVDLFNHTGLDAGRVHTLTISNLAPIDPTKPNLNLDYFWWTTEINSLTDVRIRDDSPSFTYQPVTAWDSDLANLDFPAFNAGTGHATTQSGANATFVFTGDRVALYGTIGPQGGPYSVQLDDANALTLTSQSKLLGPTYLADQILFYADTLPPGNHTVTITSNLVSPTQAFIIDYAVVDGTLNSISTSNILTPSSTAAAISLAEIAGLISSTAVLGLISLLSLIYIIHLRRRLQRTVGEGSLISSEDADRRGISEIGGHGTTQRRTLIPFPVSLQPPRWAKPIPMQDSPLDPPQYEAREATSSGKLTSQ
ncbi:hypothetical protein FB451DRAFT_1272767 [Mycena latifolia]|nr:hypothetical protein FB451DRAFT_1272767 [Mycena latifolia]